MGILEKKMEIATIGLMWGLYGGYMGVTWELYGDTGKENGNYYNRVNVGVIWGYMGIMEKKMETTIIMIGFMWGLYGSYMGLRGKYMGIMEKKMETTIMGVIWGLYGSYMGIMEKKMETTMIGFWGSRFKVAIASRNLGAPLFFFFALVLGMC